MSESPLVSTQWLHEHLNDENIRIVDIRGHVLPASEPPPHYFAHRAEYEEAHIPGAVFVDWVLDITDPDSPKAAQIAKPDAYAALMSRLGIGDDTLVVAYDDAESMFAARLWWSLNYYGHSQVVIVDGGWQKWLAEGRPTSGQLPAISPAKFSARPNPALRRTAEQVAQAMNSDKLLLDVRSVGEFEGKASRASRAGHIPGAVNLPRSEIVSSERTVPDSETLREKFGALGIEADGPEVIVYCNGGVSASYGLLALTLAGITNAAIYDGSWKEWGNDESRPIA